MSTLVPLAAFEIDANGAARPIEASAPSQADHWRWHHLDLTDPVLPSWLGQQVDPLVVTALLAPETRPRVDSYGDGLIITLRGVNLNEGADIEDMVSLRMWVTKDRIISVRKRRLMALDAIRQNAANGQAPASPSAFLAALCDGLVARIDAVTLDLEDKVDALEEHSLTTDLAHSHECLALRQIVIKLRRFVGPQREAMEELGEESTIITAPVSVHIREIANRTTRAVEALDAARDRLAAIQEHLDAQVAMKLGQNSYLLSVVAAIFLPLGFLTGLFGINVAGMPGTGWTWAFWVITGVSAGFGIALYALFRWRRWL